MGYLVVKRRMTNL